MQEKVITIIDREKKEIVGLMIVEEIELGYIKDKIILYSPQNIKNIIIAILESLEQTCINMSVLIEKVLYGLTNSADTRYMGLLEPFTLGSNNKNKSSRDKRMLKQMHLDKNLERSVVYVRKTSG